MLSETTIVALFYIDVIFIIFGIFEAVHFAKIIVVVTGDGWLRVLRLHVGQTDCKL